MEISHMSEVRLRFSIEVNAGTVEVVLLSSIEGEPESRAAIPVLPDDARLLADALFIAAKQVDPAGHQTMLDRIGTELAKEIAMRAQPGVGGVH
jgi:hypothetical protein